jgi:hypothetical protein
VVVVFTSSCNYSEVTTSCFVYTSCVDTLDGKFRDSCQGIFFRKVT